VTSQSNDDVDISRCRAHFIGQVNNTTSFFRTLTSDVQYKLFRSYCTSYYGCELWLLTNNNIEDFCVAWRKSLRKVWNLPHRTHGFLLPLISKCLPVFDEICRRVINFIRACISHESDLLRFVVSHGVFHSRCMSNLGLNVWFCCNRYRCSVADLLYRPMGDPIKAAAHDLFNDDMRCRANFLYELLSLRDNRLDLNNFALSKSEIVSMLDYICTY
jgi:hypothetical protein